MYNSRDMFVCEKDKRKSKKVKVKVALARNKFCYKVLANWFRFIIIASNKNKKVCQHFISKYQTVKVS